jgi:hypothetical protein
VLSSPGSKRAGLSSFTCIRMAATALASEIPIEPAIDGSMHLCIGWRLTRFLLVNPVNNQEAPTDDPTCPILVNCQKTYLRNFVYRAIKIQAGDD